MELNDIELVVMAKTARDDKAFAVLVKRHQAKLRAFLRRLCGEAALADDIAQETFIKAYSSLSTFRGGASFRSWLFAIAYREFLQDKRKAKAAMRRSRPKNPHPKLMLKSSRPRPRKQK